MDRFDLYELCVQSPRWLTPFLRAVHGSDPRVLREDFCGTAAISRRWIADGRKSGLDCRATGVDLDPQVLDRAAAAAGNDRTTDRLTLLRGDATTLPVDDQSVGADVVFVGNFSIGYIHDRPRLMNYLRTTHKRLMHAGAGWGGGVLVVDVYDGPGKFALGSIVRTHTGRGHEIVRYTWEHREADALTAMVTNVIHFRVLIDGDVVQEITDAFVYRWRLWSIAELREAMTEAGFAVTEVHQEISERPTPLANGMEMSESGVVCVVGRA